MTRARLGALFIASGVAVLFSGCATKIESYVKPDQNFAAYKEIAVAPFASDPKRPDTAKGAAELPAFLFAIMGAKGYSVLDPAQSVAELKKLAPPDKEFSPETLAALGKALKTSAILTGQVKYYGEYQETTAPQLGTTTERADTLASPSQRRLGFRSREQTRVQPRLTEEPADVEKEYRVTVRLELFDAPSQTVVWWSEGTVSGESDKLKTYANALFETLLKKFPMSPMRRK